MRFSDQSDPNTTLYLGIVCPCIVVAFILSGIFFLCEDKRQAFFPMYREYRVKIDFNELQRIREEADAADAARFNKNRRQIANRFEHVRANETVSTFTESEPSQAEDASVETPSTNTDDPDKTDTARPEPDFRAPPDAALAFNSTPPSLPEIGPPVFTPPELPPLKGKPLKFVKSTLKGVPFYQAVVDLKDPQMFMNIELANSADQANCATSTHGDESFPSFVKRGHGALVQNGTFFSKDGQKRVMGNMVARGRYLKYSPWENYGTTLGIKKNNEPEMVSARLDGGQPDWSSHWFSITCGPRLVHNGEVEIDATAEGFTDSHVLGVGSRCAMGFPASKDKIYIVTFLRALSLQKEGEVMKAMGCSEAMNLDGGASKALAHKGEVIVPASRALTNVIVVYDTNYPAPKNIITSWRDFQKRPDQLIGLGY